MGCSEISLGDTIGIGTPGTDCSCHAYPFLFPVYLNSIWKLVVVTKFYIWYQVDVSLLC
uniref:Uncharacterized protein n=1 Tax=Arundo donax TaxID=35708 RepID=A0A0A9E8E8_ARUDO